MVWKKSTDMISATLQHDVGCLEDSGEAPCVRSAEAQRNEIIQR